MSTWKLDNSYGRISSKPVHFAFQRFLPFNIHKRTHDYKRTSNTLLLYRCEFLQPPPSLRSTATAAAGSRTLNLLM